MFILNNNTQASERLINQNSEIWFLASDEVYQEILKWQTQLHSKSANEVQEFLSANLDQLAKVWRAT